MTGAQEVDIGYWRWYTNDLGVNPGEDWWRVDVSNDGGVSWTSIENTQASNNSWQSVSFDLFDYFTEAGQVRLRFVAEDAGAGGSLVEAAVDDFILLALAGATDVDGDLAVRFVTELDQNAPNPFNPKTQIRFSLRAAGNVSLKVFDAQGRLVRALAEGRLAAGEHQVTWDGTDAQGHSLASGVYLYRLEAEGRTLGKRMVLVK